MRRILLRAPKDPFEVVSPERHARARTSSATTAATCSSSRPPTRSSRTSGATVTPDRFGAHRLGRRPDQRALRRLRHPARQCLPAQLRGQPRGADAASSSGCGSRWSCSASARRARSRYDAARLAPMEASVRAFMSAVLDRSPSVGVRGEFTHDYLRGLGFRDVEVIGCPSMFLARRPARRRTTRPGARRPIRRSR